MMYKNQVLSFFVWCSMFFTHTFFASDLEVFASLDRRQNFFYEVREKKPACSSGCKYLSSFCIGGGGAVGFSTVLAYGIISGFGDLAVVGVAGVSVSVIGSGLFCLKINADKGRFPEVMRIRHDISELGEELQVFSSVQSLSNPTQQIMLSVPPQSKSVLLQ